MLNRRKLKPTFWLLIICCFLGIVFQGSARESEQIDFRTSGRVELYRYATMNNWRNNNAFIKTLGDVRLHLGMNIGNAAQPIHAYLPLSLVLNQYRDGMEQLSASSSDYFFVLQKEPFILSLTSRGAYYKNQNYAFNNLQDPLGALAYPNSDAPNMTLKFSGKMPGGWEHTAYFISDNRANYLPVIETIPEAVYPALGRTKENFRFYDEIPTYTMYRGTKDIFSNTFGILYGKKAAVNISPRAAADERTTPYPNHGVGYSKENYGIDYSGKLRFANNPDFALAFIGSSGEWRK